MPDRIGGRAGALALGVAALLIATPPASAARAGGVDCWVLDGAALDQARGQGMCGDAFSRNTHPGAPPFLPRTDGAAAGVGTNGTTMATFPAPDPKRASSTRIAPEPARPRAAKAKRPAEPSSEGRPARAAISGRARTDFVASFRRDWSALMRALDGDASGTARRAAPADRTVSAHTSPRGR